MNFFFTTQFWEKLESFINETFLTSYFDKETKVNDTFFSSPSFYSFRLINEPKIDRSKARIKIKLTSEVNFYHHNYSIKMLGTFLGHL